MKKLFAILLALLVLLPSAALAEAEDPAIDPAGDWYASVEGVPVTLALNPDGGYTFALPAGLSAPQTGSWVLDDGFVRLDDGSALNLVGDNLLIWTARALSFTRAPAAVYAPANLLPDATPDLYAGYWRCAWVDLGDAIVPAEAMKEATDLYIEPAADPSAEATVALGGPRFGDIFWTFGFAGGAFSADVNSQPVALALQQDGCLRLTLAGDNPAALYLQLVLNGAKEPE